MNLNGFNTTCSIYAMFKINYFIRDQRQTCWPKIISMTHLCIFTSPLMCVLMQAEDLILISNIAYVPKSYVAIFCNIFGNSLTVNNQGFLISFKFAVILKI